jgi:tyrosine-protein kinase Etk/Wzc
MTTTPAAPLWPSDPLDEREPVSLADMLDVLADRRGMIVGFTAVALAIGVLASMLSTPIYEANSLIQIEDPKSGRPGLLVEAGGLLAVGSSAAAEMEVLRSRMVLGQAAMNLRLDLRSMPRSIPVVGGWMARHASAPSRPGFLGMPGFVSGNERITVGEFDGAAAAEGRHFTVRVGKSGYQLLAEDGTRLGEAALGADLRFRVGAAEGRLRVDALVGLEGAEFQVWRLSRLAVVEQLQQQIRIVEQGRNTGVIQATLEGADPALAARLLNEIGTVFVRQNVERKSVEVAKSLAFLDGQLPQLREQLEKAEGRVSEFRRQAGVFELGAEATELLSQSGALQVRLIELEQKRRDAMAEMTAEHPLVQALDADIRAIQARIATVAAQARRLPATEQGLLRLAREAKVSAELYSTLLNSYQQMRLAKESNVGNVRIVDTAVVPELPVRPRVLPIVAGSGGAGLLLGIVVAFVLNSLRRGVRDPAEIERRTGLHVFSTVPLSPAQFRLTKGATAGRPTLLALAATQDPAIEGLRSLRTALQFAMIDARSNILLVTGPTAGVGKSFTSANLAAVLAAGGRRVLLIDADLRKGHLHRDFGVAATDGLSDMLAGTIGVEQALRREVAPNVDFLASGTLPPNPAELLLADSSQAKLRALAVGYHLVLIDTPPILVASDAAILSPLAAMVLLVARAGQTTAEELIESGRQLSRAGSQQRGVVFNGLDLSSRRYGYGKAYRDGRYGYGYGSRKA